MIEWRKKTWPTFFSIVDHKVKKTHFWLISLGQGKSDAKPENKVCRLYSKLEIFTISYRTELLTDFIWTRCLMEVKRSVEAGCFLSFSFYRNTARISFSATCIGWRGQGMSKFINFLAGLLKFLIPLIHLFVTIVKVKALAIRVNEHFIFCDILFQLALLLFSSLSGGSVLESFCGNTWSQAWVLQHWLRTAHTSWPLQEENMLFLKKPSALCRFGYIHLHVSSDFCHQRPLYRWTSHGPDVTLISTVFPKWVVVIHKSHRTNQSLSSLLFFLPSLRSSLCSSFCPYIPTMFLCTCWE